MSFVVNDENVLKVITETLDAHKFGELTSGGIDSKEAEMVRITSIRHTLTECNGTSISVESRTGPNLLGVPLVEVTRPDDLYVALLGMMVKDNAKYGVDVWGSESLNVHGFSKPPCSPVSFPLWRMWLCMYRMGFRPNKICSTAMYGAGSFWENVFKGITSWTFNVKSFTMSFPIYYAKVLADTSERIVKDLVVHCVSCRVDVKLTLWHFHRETCKTQSSNTAVSHVETSKKRKGKHVLPGVLSIACPSTGVQETPTDPPETSKKHKGQYLHPGTWTNAYPPAEVQETAPVAPGLTNASDGYQFKTFEFRGPTWSDLHGRHYAPLPYGTEEFLRCYTSLAPLLTPEELAHWHKDPFEFDIEW